MTLVDVMLLGHWIEMRSVLGASRALEHLVRLLPSTVHRIQGDTVQDVPLEKIKTGDVVLVRPGEKIPVDGLVLKGASDVNEAFLTGESKPVSKEPGDHVIAGAVNDSGSLTIEVKKTGEDSYLSNIISLVDQVSASKSRSQDTANKAAFYLTIVALGGGFITLVIWLTVGQSFAFSLERMVTVMVIACPHALGLAIPLVISMISGIAARNGLLIRNKTAFERMGDMDTIVFDKTGTLTSGSFSVTDVIAFQDISEDEILKRAAALEVHAKHFLGQAIIKKIQEKKIEIPDVKNFNSLSGKGIYGVVQGQEIFVGNMHMLEHVKEIFSFQDHEINNVKKQFDELMSQGKTVVFVITQQGIQGLIALADTVRSESLHACQELLKQGKEVYMITGDNPDVARHVAQQLGIKHYFARVLPDQKSSKIVELQKQGKKVVMVGDGINDAPALVQADVGIAIGAGTDIAIESADIVLVRNDPRDVISLIELSKISRRKIIQNLFWAAGYNVISMPLAAGLLYGYGIILQPAIGALIMSLSTVIVAVNARLIRYKR